MEWNVKHINPGFEEGKNSLEYTLQINCNFADQIYAKYLDKKWGVNACASDELLRYTIKKQFLDLDNLFIKTLCHPVCLPPINACVEMYVFRPVWCYTPTDPSVSFYIPVIVCNAPTGPSVQFDYARIR